MGKGYGVKGVWGVQRRVMEGCRFSLRFSDVLLKPRYTHVLLLRADSIFSKKMAQS